MNNQISIFDIAETIILDDVKTKITNLQNEINENISEDLILSILFEMGRYFDEKLKYEYKKIQKEENRVFNSFERKLLRYYFYYGKQEILDYLDIKHFIRIDFSLKDKMAIVNDVTDRLEKYGHEKIINSIKEKIKELENTINDITNSKEWLKWYNRKYSKDKASFIIINIDQKFVENNDYEQNLYDIIKNAYMSLINYRYIAITINGHLVKNNIDITWDIAHKISIYCENFVQNDKPFFAFKKSESTSELADFINDRIKDAEKSKQYAENFYNRISSGFKFEDCIIDNKQNKKTIIFKKLELDDTPVPCPSCLSMQSRGNSYPEVFLKSWECSNPNCPNRSKSGRGKRYDEFGTYRYFKMIENNDQDIISEQDYTAWRRDIYSSDNNIIDMLIKYYSFSGETIYSFNTITDNTYGRNIKELIIQNINENNIINNYYDLPIIKLFNSINNNIDVKKGNNIIKNNIEVINGDSTTTIATIKNGIIGTAITSPPYYNAREYSQWKTLILYLIDMMLNAKSIYYALDENGSYLYNIGDIVAEDNVYVKSKMSERRLMLGFYSIMIFKIVGFNISNNIIWDKGEVQSKRNSTINMFPTYVKCINCYEHVFIFTKNNITKAPKNYVEKILPVFKINCKGENIYKHTAPYPIELVSLVEQFANKDKYILDPFLGSGTTLKWCKQNNYKGIGIELNKEYYDLCLENLKD